MFNQGQSTGWNSFFFTQFFFYHPNEVLIVKKTKGQIPVRHKCFQHVQDRTKTQPNTMKHINFMSSQ